MSRNSKTAKRIAFAKTMKRAKQSGATIVSTGPVGPAKTTPKHNKKLDNRSKYNRADRKGVTAGGKRKEAANDEQVALAA